MINVNLLDRWFLQCIPTKKLTFIHCRAKIIPTFNG